MRRAVEHGMHTYSFLMKRGHWSAVRMGIRMFARVPEMTAARFDLMHVLYQAGRAYGIRNGGLSQVLLQRRLGVRRQTVWAMVVRLVDLGLVSKTYDHNRRVLLTLTEDGIKRIHLAYRAAFTSHHPLPAEWRNEADVPRWVYRLARDEARARAEVDPPRPPPGEDTTRLELVGSEVRRAINYQFWRHAGCSDRRPRYYRFVDKIDEMVYAMIDFTRALGDTSTLIYPLHWESDH